MHIRTTRIEIPVSEGPVYAQRVEMRVDGSLLLSIPLTLDNYSDDEGEGEEHIPSKSDFQSIYQALTGYDPEGM